jgi:hypothetical protein
VDLADAGLCPLKSKATEGDIRIQGSPWMAGEMLTIRSRRGGALKLPACRFFSVTGVTARSPLPEASAAEHTIELGKSGLTN